MKIKGESMNKKIIILFLLLASFVVFMPEQDKGATAERSVTTFSPAGAPNQIRYRRRRRLVYYRYRPVYRYRVVRRVRPVRARRWHWVRRYSHYPFGWHKVYY